MNIRYTFNNFNTNFRIILNTNHKFMNTNKTMPQKRISEINSIAKNYNNDLVELKGLPAQQIYTRTEYLDKIYSSSPYDFSNKTDEELLKNAANIAPIKPNSRSMQEAIELLKQNYNQGKLTINTREDILENKRKNTKSGSNVDFDLIGIEVHRILNDDTLKVYASSIDSVQEYNNEYITAGKEKYLFATQALDSIAALHAFYTNKAESMYTGEELENIKTQINEQIFKNTNVFSDELVSNFKNINIADKEGFKSSINAIITDRSLQYQNTLSDGFTTGVEGTIDEWASNSGYFVAAKLVQNSKSAITDTAQPNAKYTAADIKAAVALEIEFANYGPVYELSGNEEEIGFELGLLGIKSEIALSNRGISQNGKTLLRLAYENHIDKVIKASNNRLDFLRNDSYTDKTFYSYSPLNENAILKTINKTLDTLNNSNFEQSILNVIDDCSNMIISKKLQQEETTGKIEERYSNSDYFSYNNINTKFEHYNLFISFIDSSKSIRTTTGFDVNI